jgi:hypothetical protein
VSVSPANDAEAYAVASFELATAAVDEAILAALQAVLARGDVEKPAEGTGVEAV